MDTDKFSDAENKQFLIMHIKGGLPVVLGLILITICVPIAIIWDSFSYPHQKGIVYVFSVPIWINCLNRSIHVIRCIIDLMLKSETRTDIIKPVKGVSCFGYLHKKPLSLFFKISAFDSKNKKHHYIFDDQRLTNEPVRRSNAKKRRDLLHKDPHKIVFDAEYEVEYYPYSKLIVKATQNYNKK